MNLIEFGEGVYGILNASHHYFRKHPLDLSAKEGAFLAMLLPNPTVYSQSFRDQELTEFAEKRIQTILTKMERKGYLSADELEIQRDSLLRFERVPKPSVESIESAHFMRCGHMRGTICH